MFLGASVFTIIDFIRYAINYTYKEYKIRFRDEESSGSKQRRRRSKQGKVSKLIHLAHEQVQTAAEEWRRMDKKQEVGKIRNRRSEEMSKGEEVCRDQRLQISSPISS